VTMDTTAEAPPRPEFLALGGFYKSELEPWLEAHEGRRQRARLLRWLIIGGGFAALAVAAGYVLTQTDDSTNFWLFVLFVLAIVVVILGNIPMSNLRSEVKTFVMEKLAGFFGFSYEARPTFETLADFKDLSLLPHHDNARFEDGLRGAVKGVPFEMVEVHLTERRGTGKERKTVTVFRGLLLALPWPEAGEEAVTVWRRDVDQWNEDSDVGPVKLGDDAFDQAYIVHSDNVETARRLLGRDARAALAVLEQRDTIDDVRVGIGGGRLLLAFRTGTDSFEAGKMSRRLADPNRVQDMVELFALPFDAVDGFKLQQPASPPAPASRSAP